MRIFAVYLLVIGGALNLAAFVIGADWLSLMLGITAPPLAYVVWRAP